MNPNDKIKSNIIDYIENAKVRLNEAYGVQSLAKGERK